MSRPVESPATYRPRLADGGVEGARCSACAGRYAPAIPRCPSCGARTVTTTFTPRGNVWSSTTVHVTVGDRQPPYSIAYVDLDDGPRLLVGVNGPEGVAIGDRVVVTTDPHTGDLVAAPADEGGTAP